MNRRQFLWGLSGGATVLAIAGFFWYGVSFGVITTGWGWWAWGFSTAFQLAVTCGILWASIRLRRRSGFNPKDTARAHRHTRAVTQRILRMFGWIVIAQAVLIALAVWFCVRTGAKDLIWPTIGLIVSLHFAPLARLFHVRVYYATALAGTLISLAGFAGLNDMTRLLWFGGAMAAVMWLSAGYIIRNAGKIATRTMHENW
jgi:hypothetical protein